MTVTIITALSIVWTLGYVLELRVAPAAATTPSPAQDREGPWALLRRDTSAQGLQKALGAEKNLRRRRNCATSSPHGPCRGRITPILEGATEPRYRERSHRAHHNEEKQSPPSPSSTPGFVDAGPPVDIWAAVMPLTGGMISSRSSWTLGRVPTARLSDREWVLRDREVSREDIDWVVDRVGEFDADNRAGITRTRTGLRRSEPYGTGRRPDVPGRSRCLWTITIIQDLIESVRRSAVGAPCRRQDHPCSARPPACWPRPNA